MYPTIFVPLRCQWKDKLLKGFIVAPLAAQSEAHLYSAQCSLNSRHRSGRPVSRSLVRCPFWHVSDLDRGGGGREITTEFRQKVS
jgi:hypothetical protein